MVASKPPGRLIVVVGLPSVGVVLPVLNAVATIDTAVASIVDQVPGVHQIVVVDGGSTDGTLEILAHRRDIEVERQVRTGLAAARNLGIAKLRTEIVAFCDADDRWLPGSLDIRVRHLLDHPACGAVAGSVITRALHGHQVPPHRLAQIGRLLPGYTPGAVLARRRVFDEVGGFDEDLHIAADSGWLARLLASDVRLDMLDEIVLEKGIGESSLSTDLDLYRGEMLSVVRSRLSSNRSR